jgi:light-harvesting complex 1 beta chain
MAQIRTTTRLHAAKGSFGGYQLIFAASLLVFFAIALTGQMLGLDWRSWLPGAEGAKSLHGGVKAAVYTFMSHIQ